MIITTAGTTTTTAPIITTSSTAATTTTTATAGATAKAWGESKYVIDTLAILSVLFCRIKCKGKDNSDLIQKIMKMDEEAEKRAEEHTRKWLKQEEEREARRMQREEEHELRMFSLYSLFMSQVTPMFRPPSDTTYPPYHGFSPYPSSQLQPHPNASQMYGYQAFKSSLSQNLPQSTGSVTHDEESYKHYNEDVIQYVGVITFDVKMYHLCISLI